MPSDAWVDASNYPDDYSVAKSIRRSTGTVRRIMDKPTDIVIQRAGEFLDEQTVRIEGRGVAADYSSRVGSNAVGFVRGITVFGVRNHPELPDLDIKVSDRFGYNEALYVVTGVTLHAGEIQASCERYQP